MPVEVRSLAGRLWLAACLALAGLSAALAQGSELQAPDACLEDPLPNNQIVCLVRAARAANDVGPCFLSDQSAVRWQCVAIHAEETGESGLCDALPEAATDSPRLERDLCRAHLALTWRTADFCLDMATAGLADACFYQFVETGGDPALCGRIADPDLRRLCGPDGGAE